MLSIDHNTTIINTISGIVHQESKKVITSNASIITAIIIGVWLAVIIGIIIFRYKNRTDQHLVDTNRRAGQRRDDSTHEKDDPESEDSDNRKNPDRRNASDWQSDYNQIRARIENETDKEST